MIIQGRRYRMTCGIPEMIQDESSGVWVKNPDYEWFMAGFEYARKTYLEWLMAKRELEDKR